VKQEPAVANGEFEEVYAELRERMIRAAPNQTVVTDSPGHLVLHAPIPNPLKPAERMWFGGVQIRKGYVSYHLMPVYSHSALLDHASPELAKRMQGKSCFNFRKSDPALFDELERLTAEGARLYGQPLDVEKGRC
jgi:hypothetical protein